MDAAQERAEQAPTDRPFLERLGVAYFRRLSRTLPPVEAMDEIHVLNPQEQRELRAIERGTVTRAAAVGALSGLASALAEVYAVWSIGVDPDAFTWGDTATFWAIVGAVTGVATFCEIAFLYWDALRSVHRLARAAGLTLFPRDGDGTSSEVAAALARAALELPNPPGIVFGVDPHREVSKARLIVVALAYKLKVGVTNFLLKALLRRMLGRFALRVWLVFAAVPVTAFWNAVVAFLVIRQARIRAMGPSAAGDIAMRLLAPADLSADGKVAALRAAAATIVRTHDPHPNLVAFLREVRRHAGDGGDADLDDTQAFIAELPALQRQEQDVVLRVLCVGAVLDGRLTGDERRLIAEAVRACGRPDNLTAVLALRRVFVRGQPVDDRSLFAVAPEPA